MANISTLVPIVLKWEGRQYTNTPGDLGGPTKMGVTLKTWQSIGYDKDKDGDIDVNDLKLIEDKDYETVLRKYWNRWKADDIKNQSIANLLVDWVFNSGSWGITIPQRLLGVKQDGVVGAKTIAALNAQHPKTFFQTLYNARLAFYNNIVKNNPSQRKFLNGWKNRLDDFKYFV